MSSRGSSSARVSATAHAAKTERLQAKVAKAEASLASARAELAAHQATIPTSGGRTDSTRVSGKGAQASGGRRSGSNGTRSRLAPGNPPDVNFMRRVFTGSELRDQLSKYTVVSLKQGAREVQSRNPGTQPRSLSKRQDLVDYLLTYS